MFLNYMYEKFIPDKIKNDNFLYPLGKNLIGVCIIGCIACLLFSAYYSWLHFYAGFTAVLIEFFVLLLMPWVFKYTESVVLVREITVSSVAVALLWLTYQLGGLYAASVFWLLLPPFVAMFLDCISCSIIWSILITTALIIFYFFMHNSPEGMGLIISKPLDMQLVSLIGLNFSVVALGYFVVSGKRSSLDKLQYLAFHDALTGLINRSGFDTALEHELKLMKETGQKIALYYFDIDNFKTINDVLGHRTGDAVLMEVASRIEHFIKNKAVLSRRGGDEFTLYYIYDEENELKNLANTFLELIRQPLFIDGLELHIRISIGLARAPFDAEDAMTLIKKSDIALYQAKKSGKNLCFTYVEDIGKNANNRLVIERELPKAISNNEFYLQYQPQFDTKNLKFIVGVEALLRWTSPTLGNIRPDEFIPIAENLGLIKSIDSWVLLTACQHYKSWEEKGIIKFPCKIAINISSVELQVSNFADTLTDIIAKTKINPAVIELEINETSLGKKQDLVVLNLQKIKSLGINVAIDDFGKGNSSLSYLTQVNFNTLKIDKSFLQDIPYNKANLTIIKSIIDLGRDLNIKTVAEGVETVQQMKELHKLNCDALQGFYLSKPLGIAALESLFLQNYIK